jgi:capsular exopolysaccharide synthesis family protein
MPEFKPTLITLTHPRSPAVEAYRALRANLAMYSLDHPLHALVVTSAAPGEDQSTALANLAIVIAQGGQRVILVDADVRHPSLHELFGVPNERGLTTLLEEQDALSAPPLAPVTDVDELQLLTSGPLPLDPAAQLGSKRMEEVIAALQKRADVVLFDAPPVLAATDAVMLGMKTDGVLLVVQAGHTSREHLQQAKEKLERAHVHIIGVTLTNAPTDKSLGY